MKFNKNIISPLSAGIFLIIVFAGSLFFFLFMRNSSSDKSAYSQIFSKGHNTTVPISNQWFSNMFASFPSNPIFAFPLAYRFSPEGLSVSYPMISATANTIAAPFIEDFTIGNHEIFKMPKLSQLGDWTLTAQLNSAHTQLDITIGHGLPFTIIKSRSEIALQFPDPSARYLDTQNHQITSASKLKTFLIQIHNHNYVVVLDKSDAISFTQATIIIHNPHTISIALLDSMQNRELFERGAIFDIQGTQATYSTTGATIDTTYTVYSKKPPLIALLPHQIKFLTSPVKVIGTYDTLRGKLQLIQTHSFKTSIPKIIPERVFHASTQNVDVIKTAIHHDIADIMKSPLPASQDYFLGTWLGKASNLLLLADAYSLKSDKTKLLTFIEPIFIKSLDSFYYSSDLKSIIATHPEFGNEKLNDHNFHYGYFIRTAAVLSQLDPQVTSSIQEKVERMVSDIATIDRQATQYPYLRNFDIYEGHSWADGWAKFGDGNDLESTSEAIQAWYGVYLWSNVVKNTERANIALALYNTEIQSAFTYWFNTQNIYPTPYTHAIASLVWGGKADYATWFSGETNMIYGIQLLPFTPASQYLGKLPDFSKYKADYENNRGSTSNDWGDLFAMWESFYNPQAAITDSPAVTKFEGDNPKSLFYHYVYSSK